jgi:regulation of enolase protein 1 (concanavalin A-like superfamily)
MLSPIRSCLVLAPTILLLLANSPAQEAPPAGEVPAELRLAALSAPLAVVNHPVSVRALGERSFELVAPARTNLFNSPDGNFVRQDAAMLLFPPDRDFVLTARVSAELRSVYDVAALVVYQDGNTWAKFCYENSVERQPTLVSVVTRGLADDCNSIAAPADGVYLAIVRKGDEFAFHASTDGRVWRLIRHFSLPLAAGARLGFAAHGSGGTTLRAVFSEINYQNLSSSNVRRLEVTGYPPSDARPSP